MNNHPRFVLAELQPADPAHLSAVAELWNEACGEDLAISARLVRYNLAPGHDLATVGLLALVGETVVGAVIGSVYTGAAPAPGLVMPHHGWIELLAVRPAWQRQGIGRALLAWAETELRRLGARELHIGGGLRHFLPGVPATSGCDQFFVRQGFSERYRAWDIAADLSAYQPPAGLREAPAAVRPAQPGQMPLLIDFLRREFPDRWHYEAHEFVREGGRVSDYMLLWTEAGVGGFLRLGLADSLWPLERYAPYRLPRPWAQIGSVGIAAALQRKGYGSCLLDASLRRLHNLGVNGCLIDWTAQQPLYRNFGFSPYREYVMLGKQ